MPGFADKGEDLLQRADSLFAAERYEDAAPLYEGLLSVAAPGPQRIRLLQQLGECHYKLGDYRASREHFEAALIASTAAGDPFSVARSRHLYGKVLTSLAEYGGAEAQLIQALSFWQGAGEGNSEAAADCLEALGIVHLYLDELEEAAAQTLKAAEIRKEISGPEDLKVTQTYVNLGNIFARMGRADEAGSYYLKSLEIRKKELPFPHILLGTVYYNYGRLLADQGRLREGMENYLQALEIYEALDPEHSRTGDVCLAIGQGYVGFGDYRTGRDFFLRALRIYRKAFGEKQERVGTMYNLLANIYRLNGDYEQARSYAEQGLRITRSVLGDFHDRVASGLTTVGDIEADAGNSEVSLKAYRQALDIRRQILGDDHLRTAFLYFLLGQATQEAGRPAEAIPWLERALAIYRHKGMEGSEDMTNVYASLGRTYLDLGKYGTALEYLRRDARILHRLYGETHPYLADSYRSLAMWHESRGQLDSALVLFHEALCAMSLDFDDPDLYAVPPLTSILSPLEFLDILKRKGDAFVERNADRRDLEAALSTYRRGAELIDRMRNQYRSQGAKLFFQESADPLFIAGFRAAYQLYEATQERHFLEEAFWFAERSKAGLLTAALQGVVDRPFAGVPDSLRGQAQSLRSRLDGLEQMVMDERLWPSDTTGLSLRRLKREQAQVQTSYDSLLALLEMRYPQFFELSFGTETATLAGLQKRIPDRQTALLEYFIADSTLYTFLLTRETIRLDVAPWGDSLEADIAYLRRPPEPGQWHRQPSVQARAYLQRSRRLFQVLIGDKLRDLSCDRLVIIPHGRLAYLSFEGLAGEEADDFHRASFLVRHYAIQYAYSATLWLGDHGRGGPSNTRFLGMAPGYDGTLADASRDGRPSRASPESLRFNDQEIRRAAAFFPGRLFSGPAATESAFKSNASLAGILHLSMHALVSDSLPMQSSLLFAEEADTAEDGLLYAYELYNLHLPAAMAVLSACNTGFGRLQAGEGVMSLAHAFRFAGCRSIVMSLWPAEDEGTALILERFYGHLAKGLPKDKALRQARLDYLDQADPLHAHPYYWAHLVTQGLMSPLKAGSGLRWFAVLGLLLLVVFGIYLLRR